jgi:hypothetical protein
LLPPEETKFHVTNKGLKSISLYYTKERREILNSIDGNDIVSLCFPICKEIGICLGEVRGWKRNRRSLVQVRDQYVKTVDAKNVHLFAQNRSEDGEAVNERDGCSPRIDGCKNLVEEVVKEDCKAGGGESVWMGWGGCHAMKWNFKVWNFDCNWHTTNL